MQTSVYPTDNRPKKWHHKSLIWRNNEFIEVTGEEVRDDLHNQEQLKRKCITKRPHKICNNSQKLEPWSSLHDLYTNQRVGEFLPDNLTELCPQSKGRCTLGKFQGLPETYKFFTSWALRNLPLGLPEFKDLPSRIEVWIQRLLLHNTSTMLSASSSLRHPDRDLYSCLTCTLPGLCSSTVTGLSDHASAGATRCQ